MPTKVKDPQGSSFWINVVLTIFVIIWIVPAFGVLVTSFRKFENITSSGWWTIFPHKALVKSDEVIILPEGTDVNGPITIEGQTHSFEEWREGIQMEDGRILQWYGNKRTLKLEVSEERFVWFDTQMTLENYQQVLFDTGTDLSNAFLNSVAVAIPATVIPILIAAFAAYAFAWMNFWGRKTLFIIVVALLVVPLQIALVPILQDYNYLQINNTFLAIWMAHTGFGLPLAVYLLFNYISELPRETLEAAFIDGASHFTIFTKLILPLSVPALASFAIFQFLWVWNDYLVALIFLGGRGGNEVITMALANMVGDKGQDWHLLTSGAFISMILPLTVFFGLQRFFVRGLMAGSVKG